MWVPMGAQVPVLSPNDHPNPSQGQQKICEKIQILKILLPLARHLEERPNVSQSLSQAGKQSIRQLVGQVGRQTGKQFGFFSIADYDYKLWGTRSVQEHSAVEWLNTQPMVCLAPIRFPAGGLAIAGSADRPLGSFLYLTPIQILLTTHF